MTPLQKCRELKSLTRKQIAVAVGIEVSHYYRIEMGQAQASPVSADKLAKYLGPGITRDQILYPADYVAEGEAEARCDEFDEPTDPDTPKP